jgi:hypothetical protein
MMYRGEKDFQKEMLDWQLNQIRMREKYSDTPAGFSEPEAAQRAYKKWQQSRENHERTRKLELLSEYHPAEEFFVGRNEELKAISDALKKNRGRSLFTESVGSGKARWRESMFAGTGKCTTMFCVCILSARSRKPSSTI